MIEITDHENQLYVNPTLLGEGNFKVIVGENNSGKSTLLRFICKGRQDAHFVNVNRAVITGEGSLNKDYINNKVGFSAQVKDALDDNVEGKNLQILQELMSLSDSDRKRVINYYNKYFPNKASIKREDPKNTASAKLLMMNGHSIRKQGSGARAILEILIKLFDPSIRTLCIDEPEFALEPKLQKHLLNALKERIPEKQIILATHSYLFLDREDISNNYICRRDSKKMIRVEKLKNEIELRNVIFRLLGSDLSDLSLPDKLVIVEGPSDLAFIKKIVQLKGKKHSIFEATGDSKIKPTLEGITNFLRFVTDLAPVYLDRIWVIADKQTDNLKVREWRKLLGKPKDQGKILVLTYEGIEFYYPTKLLQQIFNTRDPKEKIVKTFLRSSPNGYNGINITKKELAQKVVDAVDENNIEANELVSFVEKLN